MSEFNKDISAKLSYLMYSKSLNVSDHTYCHLNIILIK